MHCESCDSSSIEPDCADLGMASLSQQKAEVIEVDPPQGEKPSPFAQVDPPPGEKPSPFARKRQRKSLGSEVQSGTQPVQVVCVKYADNGGAVNTHFDVGECCFVILLDHKGSKANPSAFFEFKSELTKWVAAEACKIPNGPQSVSDLEPQYQVAFHGTGVSPDWVKACYVGGGPDGLEFGLSLLKDYLDWKTSMGLAKPTVHLWLPRGSSLDEALGFEVQDGTAPLTLASCPPPPGSSGHLSVSIWGAADEPEQVHIRVTGNSYPLRQELDKMDLVGQKLEHGYERRGGPWKERDGKLQGLIEMLQKNVYYKVQVAECAPQWAKAVLQQ